MFEHRMQNFINQVFIDENLCNLYLIYHATNLSDYVPLDPR
jgi:hypothetical protein